MFKGPQVAPLSGRARPGGLRRSKGSLSLLSNATTNASLVPIEVPGDAHSTSSSGSVSSSTGELGQREVGPRVHLLTKSDTYVALMAVQAVATTTAVNVGGCVEEPLFISDVLVANLELPTPPASPPVSVQSAHFLTGCEQWSPGRPLERERDDVALAIEGTGSMTPDVVDNHEARLTVLSEPVATNGTTVSYTCPRCGRVFRSRGNRNGHFFCSDWRQLATLHDELERALEARSAPG